MRLPLDLPCRVLLVATGLFAFTGCGTEEEPTPDSGTDAGGDTVDATPDTTGPCDTPNPSITCRNTGCGAGFVCVEDPDTCVPSMCTCDPVTGWMCTADCGTAYECVPEDNRYRCGEIAEQDACDGLSSAQCEWVEVPGCEGGSGEVILGAAGCFPYGSCATDTDCPAGYACETSVIAAPRCYWEEPLCDACLEERSLCMPRGI